MKLIFVCLLFLSCTAGNGSKSQVKVVRALDCNMQEKDSVLPSVCLELSQTYFTTSPQPAQLTIINNTQWNCVVGYEYFIEKKNDGWERKTLKNATFDEVGLGILPKSTLKLQISLNNVCSKYTKGTYRVGKKIRIETTEGYRDTICYCLFKVL